MIQSLCSFLDNDPLLWNGLNFFLFSNGFISHHWSSLVQITFVGKIKIILDMNNIKMHQSLSWYIASVRLEGFIRTKRELQHFLQEEKVSFPMTILFHFFLFSLIFNSMIKSKCFIFGQKMLPILQAAGTILDSDWLLPGSLTFVFSRSQTWPGNSCVPSPQPAGRGDHGERSGIIIHGNI